MRTVTGRPCRGGIGIEAPAPTRRDWPEQRKRVLAKIEAMREALARGGVDAQLRRFAGELGELLDTPRSGA